MVWLAADDYGEYIFLEKPKRVDNEWCVEFLTSFENLAFGDINRLIGRTLTFEDDPVEIDITFFQFKSEAYSKEQTQMFDRKLCEHLSKVDQGNVTKFDGSNFNLFMECLNYRLIDNRDYWFRIFSEEEKRKRFSVIFARYENGDMYAESIAQCSTKEEALEVMKHAIDRQIEVRGFFDETFIIKREGYWKYNKGNVAYLFRIQENCE